MHMVGDSVALRHCSDGRDGLVYFEVVTKFTSIFIEFADWSNLTSTTIAIRTVVLVLCLLSVCM
jgi:hypothetical protein